MTFLPIVERELRVAARKRWTFWLRVCAAAVALLIGSAFFALTILPGGFGKAMGGALFGTLTWLSLAGVLSTGLFFTSDCLSEEKRAGTLGFLFLTDLRGYDVVLGKLLTTSLRGSFAVLAIFPVLATTFLMGGVPAEFFWKTLLALMNALFFSLAAGMFVSALSRDSQKAMAGTLFLLLLILAGAPAVDSLLRWFKVTGNDPLLALGSPVYAFASAEGWSPVYWRSLIVSHVIGWLFLGMASFLIPRNWQVKARKISAGRFRASTWWRYGGPRRREKLRQKFLDRNPVMWLACRERWQAMAIWLAGAVVMLLMALLWFGLPREVWWMWMYLGGLSLLIFYLWTASQATRFFSEARASGLVELLLATPLAGREILRGQWRAMLRQFGPPVLVLVVAVSIAEFLAYRSMWGRAFMSPGPNGVGASDELIQLMVPLGAAALISVVIIARLVALCWFGFWMAMTSRSAHMATLKTFLFVQIIPWLVIQFLRMFLMPVLMLYGNFNQGSGNWPAYLMMLTMTVFPSACALVKDVILWLWARSRLFSGFREMAIQATAPAKLSRSLPAPPPIAPPVAPARP